MIQSIKRTFIGIFLLSFVFHVCPGQRRQAIDSLHRLLAEALDDTSRINAEIRLCLLHRLGNTDSSILYGQRALESANRVHYVPGQIQALSFMCIVTEQQGNLPGSLEMGFGALRLADENNMHRLAAPALDGIGETYIILKDYSRALSYLRMLIPPSRFNATDEGLAYGYYDMGIAFLGINQLDSAEYYEQRAIETFAKYDYVEPLIYQVLGDIKIKSGNLQQALEYYKRSLELSLQKNEPRASTYAYNKIATVLAGLNQPDSAIFYARKGLEESQFIAQKRTIFEAAALLSDLYESKDTRESLRYLKIADAYKDSLFGAGNIQAVQVLIAQNEEHQREIEASRARYRNNLKQFALLAGLGIFVLVAVILYRNNRQKRKANKVLANTLDSLRSTQAQLIQSEKMASLGELTAGIAHEIQNPLNFVNNFSEVNKELIEELKGEKSNVKSERDDELEAQLLNDIGQNLEKINHHGKRADAIVKGMLQHSGTSMGQKELTDINALCDEYLRLAYHGLRAKDKSFNATLQTNFDNSMAKINVVPQDIGRVILNLVNNAFYAVNEKTKQPSAAGGYAPQVIVSTKKLNDKMEISIKDNGDGIPSKIVEKIFQPFFTTKPTGQGTGLGLSLSYDIIKAHGGEIRVETKETDYTRFIITLPV